MVGLWWVVEGSGELWVVVVNQMPKNIGFMYIGGWWVSITVQGLLP